MGKKHEHNKFELPHGRKEGRGNLACNLLFYIMQPLSPCPRELELGKCNVETPFQTLLKKTFSGHEKLHLCFHMDWALRPFSFVF